MKRIIMIALVFAFSGFYADTAHAAVSVKVPVMCRADGDDDVYIAKMEVLDDTLLETIREGLFYLKNTESGDFVMEFTEPGDYHYRVLQEGDSSDDEYFDDTTFNVDVYVSRNDDGTLVAEPVVYELNGNKKKTAIRFFNMPTEYYRDETESEMVESEAVESETAEPEMTESETDRPETEPETEKNTETGGSRPDRDSGSGRGTEPGPGSTSVKTMDQTPLELFGALLALSGVSVIILAGNIMRRRRKGGCRR